VHEGLQDQPLLQCHQQRRQFVGIMAGIEGALGLGGSHQAGEPLAEPLHEGLARFPCRAGGGSLQLGKEHPHQPGVLLQQGGMAGHQGRHLHQGERGPDGGGRSVRGLEGVKDGGTLQAGLEAVIELRGGPGHRLSPERLTAGEMAEQGAMAHAHPLGDGGGADRVRSGAAGQLQQRSHRMGTAFGGGNGGGAGHERAANRGKESAPGRTDQALRGIQGPPQPPAPPPCPREGEAARTASA